MITPASQYLLQLAEQIAAPYAHLPTARAAMVTGSSAKGLSDYHSDLDMTIYYEESLPDEEALEAIRKGHGAETRKWLMGDPQGDGFAEAFDIHGIEVQIGHTTIAAWEESIDSVLVKLEVDTPTQKALEGTLACLPLFGDELIDGWKARIAAYPPELAEAMVKKNLHLFAVWGLQHHFQTRDATVWYHAILVENAQKLLAILAGLNRIYFTTFQFKRMGYFVEQLSIKPERFGERLEALFSMPMDDSMRELEQLLQETLALVETHLPEIDTTAAKRRIGWRQSAWEPVPL